MRGIEPPSRAWEARVLPLNYTRRVHLIVATRLRHEMRLAAPQMVMNTPTPSNHHARPGRKTAPSTTLGVSPLWFFHRAKPLPRTKAAPTARMNCANSASRPNTSVICSMAETLVANETRVGSEADGVAANDRGAGSFGAMPRPCHVLRVFTRDGDGGNALGVVNDHVGMNTEKMQRVAADLGFSETSFVDWQRGKPPMVRIFTPAAEMPFAGHPMVGTAWVFHHLGPGGVDHLRCQTGDVAIRSDDNTTWIEVPPLGTVVPVPDVSDQLTRAGIPVPKRSWLVEMPLHYLILELGDSSQVRDLDVDFDALDQFGTYVYARSGSTVHARFFAPGHGVPEDPATGSAAVALAAALTFDGETSGSVTIFQGEEMGHPSQIEMQWTPESVCIGGGVVRDEVRLLDV